MTSASLKLVAAVSVFWVPTWCGAEPTPPAPAQESRVDDVRRELQELPNTRHSGGARTPLLEVNIPAPLLVPSEVRSLPPEARTSAPSQGWLLDAMQENRTGHRNRAHSNGRGRENEPELPNLRRSAEPTALDGYLETWLSAQDRDVLMPAVVKGYVSKPKEGTAEQPWRPRSTIDAKPLLTEARQRGRTPPNPYLEAAAQDASFFAERITPSASRAAEPLTLPTQAFPAIGRGAGEASKVGRSSASSEDEMPAPTTPLLDEQRYFPQLRKF